jgi:hypothetical protein
MREAVKDYAVELKLLEEALERKKIFQNLNTYL